MTREEIIKVFNTLLILKKVDCTKDELEECCKAAIKALEQKSTTKENLGVDKEQLKTMIRGLTKWYAKRDNTEVGEPNTAVGLLYDDVMFGIDRLPSVTPQEPILDKIFSLVHPLSIMSTPELEHKAIIQIAEMLEPLCLPESEDKE